MAHPSRTILIVDDSPEDRELYRRYLLRDQEYTYTILEAALGQAGLSLWHQQPDIVLLDYRLPDLDGLEFLAQLQSPTQHPCLPVIVVTGQGNEAIAVQAMKAGAQDYLVKEQLTADTLRIAINATITQVKLRQQLQQSEAALQESETRFRQLAENIDAVFWIQEVAEQRVSYLSPAYNRLWGFDPHELYENKQAWVDHIHPDDRAASSKAFREKAAAGQFDEEYRIVLPNGSIRWVRDRCFPLRDDAGTVYRLTGIAEDITDRKWSEQALRESEALFRTSVENMLDCFAIYRSVRNAAGTIVDFQAVYINDAACQNSRIPREQHLNRGLCELLPGHLASELFAAYCQVVETGQPLIKDSVIYEDVFGAQHVSKAFDIRVAKFGDGYVATWRDISDRKRTEQILRENEQRLRFALMGAQAGSWDWEIPTNKVNWSPENYALYGVEPTTGSLHYEDWYNVLHPDDRERANAEALRIVEQRLPEYRAEFRIVHPQQGDRWLLGLGRLTFDDAGNPIRLSGINLDITERKQTEALLRCAAARNAFRVSLTEALRPLADPAEIQATANRVLGEYLGVNRVAYFEVRGADYGMDYGYVNGVPPLTGHYPMESFGPTLLAAYRRGQTVATADVVADPQLSPAQQAAYAALQIAAYIGVPLVKDGEFVAGLAVHAVAPRTWTPDEVALVEEVAERIWVAVERAQAEAMLLASHDTFRHLVENSPFGIYVVDADFRLAQVSVGAQKVFENVRPLLQRDFAEVLRVIWPEPFASEALALFRHTLETGEPYHAPSTIEHRQDIDAIESYDWKIERITLPGGRFGVVCHFYDLSERLHYEAALRDSEEQLRLATEGANVGMWYWDLQEDTLVLTEKCKALFGLPADTDMSYQVFLNRLHPDDRQRTHEAVMHSLNQGVEYDVEYRTRWSDGTVRWIAAKGNCTYDATNQPSHMMGITIDITERKQAEVEREQLLHREQAAREDAERANRIKDEFLAILSHELRSPLNPILGWTKLMQSRKFDVTKTTEALDAIERNVRLQTQLIDDLLDVAKILRGKLSMNVAPVDLRTVIAAAIETVQAAAAAKTIRLHPVLPAIGLISGDAARLQQIVWNLLSNAIKFTPLNGRVEIQLTRVDQQAQMTVSDTGKGINPDFLPHIFESFRQEDASTTRKFGGLGLGLAIVRYLVEAHGGIIWAESQGEGQGATFSIQLPLLKPTPDHYQAETVCKQEPDLTGMRILAVDDESDTRDLLVTLLTQYGAEVMVLASAADGLASLGTFKPDLLVSDIGMPEMDGFTFIQHLRALPPEKGGQIPAIALTAYAREEDYQQAIANGYNCHVAKPLDPEQFVQTIMALIRQNDASGS